MTFYQNSKWKQRYSTLISEKRMRDCYIYQDFTICEVVMWGKKSTCISQYIFNLVFPLKPLVNSCHLSLSSVNSSPDLREEKLTIHLTSKPEVWKEEEWFAVGIDNWHWKLICRKWTLTMHRRLGLLRLRQKCKSVNDFLWGHIFQLLQWDLFQETCN